MGLTGGGAARLRGPEDAAAEVAIGCLDAVGETVKPLVAGEASGSLARALAARGAVPCSWLCTAGEGQEGTPTPWPVCDEADAAFIRLPKSKERLDFMLHAAASLLAPGAGMVLLGMNAEGVRSAATRLAAVCDGVTTLETRRHARVSVGRRKDKIAGLKSSLTDWRRVQEIQIGGQMRSWVSYPGVFAKGGVDPGTAFLLDNLPRIHAGMRVLDFAGGSGVITAGVVMAAPDAHVEMIEADVLALEAARENVPVAKATLGAKLGAATRQRHDLILSNPPIHEGVRESRAILDALIRAAPRHLEPGGEIRLVVQRRVPVLDELNAAFGNAAVVADNGRFTVASAQVQRASRRQAGR